MRRISHPQVVVSPIQPTPGATHYVVTTPHRPFNSSARLLIPDCARPSAFRPRSSPSSRRLLFTVTGVVDTDLPHGELPSLQLTTQPLLHRLGAQRYGAGGTGRGHAMQGGVGVRHAFGVSTHHTIVGVTSAGQHNQQADNQQQRVQQPLHGSFFQAPYDTHSSRAHQATGLLVRHPLSEQIGPPPRQSRR